MENTKKIVYVAKIPLIPLLLDENQLVTGFLLKANLFNNHFSLQYMSIDNDSSIRSNITFETAKKLSPLEFCTDDIIKIVKC